MAEQELQGVLSTSSHCWPRESQMSHGKGCGHGEQTGAVTAIAVGKLRW